MSLELTETILGTVTATRGSALKVTTDASGTFFGVPQGRFAVVRSVADPTHSISFAHAENVTCVRLAPSGTLCASGDASGNIKIWSVKTPPTVKFESKMFGGAVTDITWTDDGERLAATGGGNPTISTFGVSGNNLGPILGHGSDIVSCDLRKKRPYKLFTGDLSCCVGFHEGPPFKMKTVHQDLTSHKNSINNIVFAPSGDMAVAVSGGSELTFFHGETGEKLQSFESGHKGTIYTAAWSSDSSVVVTSSADKSIRAHSVVDGSLKWSSSFGSNILNMQVSVFAHKNGFASIGLNGDIAFFSADGALQSQWAGHATHAVALTSRNGKIISVGFDGALFAWNSSSSASALASKEVVERVVGAAFLDNSIVVGGSKIVAYPYDGASASVILSTAAKFIASVDSKSFVAVCGSKLTLFRDGAKTVEVGVAKDPTSLTASRDTVILGCTDGSVIVFKTDGSTLSETGTAKFGSSPVSAVAIAPGSDVIAAGDKNRFIYLFAASSPSKQICAFGQLHNAYIAGLAFTADGSQLISSAQDAGLIRWDVADGGKTRKIMESTAHADGLKALVISEGKLLTSGGDRQIKVWKL